MKELQEERKAKRGGWPVVLDWMARIRVADVDAVGTGLGLGRRQIHMHAAKLQEQGYVARPRVWDGSGPMLVVTPRGVRATGREVRSGSTPNALTTLLHGRGVSWIAAHCERRDRPWFGPTELTDIDLQVRLPRAGVAAAKMHLPDLGFLFEDERWAVEFERVSKGRDRLRRILSGYRSAQLAGGLGWVLYVCATPAIEELVTGVTEEMDRDRPTDARLKIAVRPLERIVLEASEGRSLR
jgi:hypothetical protein